MIWNRRKQTVRNAHRSVVFSGLIRLFPANKKLKLEDDIEDNTENDTNEPAPTSTKGINKVTTTIYQAAAPPKKLDKDEPLPSTEGDDKDPRPCNAAQFSAGHKCSDNNPSSSKPKTKCDCGNCDNCGYSTPHSSESSPSIGPPFYWKPWISGHGPNNQDKKIKPEREPSESPVPRCRKYSFAQIKLKVAEDTCDKLKGKAQELKAARKGAEAAVSSTEKTIKDTVQKIQKLKAQVEECRAGLYDEREKLQKINNELNAVNEELKEHQEGEKVQRGIFKMVKREVGLDD